MVSSTATSMPGSRLAPGILIFALLQTACGSSQPAVHIIPRTAEAQDHSGGIAPQVAKETKVPAKSAADSIANGTATPSTTIAAGQTTTGDSVLTPVAGDQSNALPREQSELPGTRPMLSESAPLLLATVNLEPFSFALQRQSLQESAVGPRIESPVIAVRSGGSRTLSELVDNPFLDPLAFALSAESLGTIVNGVYAAPTRTQAAAQATIVVTSRGRTLGEIVVNLIPEESFVVADDSLTQGLVGNIYDFLGKNVSKLPDFDAMTPVASVVMPDVHVPLRGFSAGFPGVEKLFEWFGIRFEGRLRIENPGEYTFSLHADDGARFYINGALVVDNDGVHASRSASGKVRLEKGLYPVRLDYFQGPRYHIQLELYWKTPGQAARTLVPANSLGRPAPRN